jgi:hypothetical protein
LDFGFWGMASNNFLEVLMTDYKKKAHVKEGFISGGVGFKHTRLFQEKEKRI